MSAQAIVSHSRLHHAIMEFIIEHGFAPEPDALAGLLGAPVTDIEDGLVRLQEYHGVVLHPGSAKIWVAHPFSSAPTNFVVRSGSDEWWAPCAWCAFGVAAVLERDVDVVTTLGATSDQVVVRVRGGALEDDGYCVHFPVPMTRAWDNVVYTCSVMLLFRTAADVDRWCRRHRIARGDVQPVATVWELAKVWYGDHRSADWKKWSAEEAREIFSRLGLTGEIWDLPASHHRV